MALPGSTADSAEARPLPFLLSLRRSRIPLALRFLTAEVRDRPPVEESLRLCAGEAAVVVCG